MEFRRDTNFEIVVDSKTRLRSDGTEYNPAREAAKDREEVWNAFKAESAGLFLEEVIDIIDFGKRFSTALKDRRPGVFTKISAHKLGAKFTRAIRAANYYKANSKACDEVIKRWNQDIDRLT